MPKTNRGGWKTCSFLLVMGLAGVVLAQAPMPEPKTAIVPRMDAQVKIDGVLDEQPWQKAVRLTPFGRNDATNGLSTIGATNNPPTAQGTNARAIDSIGGSRNSIAA